MKVKPGMISDRSPGTTFTVIMLNSESNLYVPREETFPTPLKYMDLTRETSTTLGVLLERRIDDYWNVNGDRELSSAWTGFTLFTMLNERPPDGYTWSGERLTKGKQHEGQIIFGPRFGRICPMLRNAEKNRSGLSRNQDSIMPEDCEALTSLIQRMKNSKKSWKTRVVEEAERLAAEEVAPARVGQWHRHRGACLAIAH